MTRDEIADALLALGWREGGSQKTYTRMFYKRFDTPTRCSGNDDKAGVQVVIEVSELPSFRHMPLDLAEVDITGGLADGTWIALKQYAMSMELTCVLAVIPRLLATWEFAANREA